MAKKAIAIKVSVKPVPAKQMKKLAAKEAAMDKKGGKPTAAEKKLEKKLGKKA